MRKCMAIHGFSSPNNGLDAFLLLFRHVFTKPVLLQLSGKNYVVAKLSRAGFGADNPIHSVATMCPKFS